MLSNTAETNPRPNAVCQEAAGSLCTGIMDAQVTSASRKMLPLNASGTNDHSGLRQPAVARITSQTVAPRTGKLSASWGACVFIKTLAAIAITRIKATIQSRAQSMVKLAGASFTIGE